MALTKAQKRNAEKNRRYWAEREAEALKHYITEEKEYDKEIRRIHQNMLDACQKEIESFYAKYAGAEGISLAEAKKRVSKLDIAAYERKAAKYVKEKNFSKKANEEMRLYNATMKINRLEMLKANIGLETIAGHDELEKFMAGILKGRTMDELARQAGILGKTITNNAAKAHAIVNGSFHSGTFSDRIWQYQDLMRQDLGRLLQQGLIQGKGARALTKDLRKYLIGENMAKMGGATYCVERLMRTELARVQTEAQKQSFIRNGFTHYEFIVNGGCCPICKGLSGKHFRVDKMMPGENAPPLHPHCRCSTAAWEDDAEYEAWLDYLEKGGTTEEWNASAKNEWQKKKTLENSENSSTIRSGAVSGARISDPEGEDGKAFAESFYPEIRKRKTDYKKIAKNIGKPESDILRIKNYLFIDNSLYDEDLQIWRQFDTDCAIAQSWQRLTDGKDIKPHDLTLIEHELLEMKIKQENPGIPHDEAHAIAQSKYNYKKEASEYYGNLSKSQKGQ